MNKASESVGIPADRFQILKDDVVKVLNMPSNLENSAVATGLGKGQFSFQSQRKTVRKNVQTAVPLCSFHTLVR